jgi:hypothetical protein
MQRQILPIDDEQTVQFALRRHREWREMVECSAWGDYISMVQRSRDGIVHELVAGTPNRYGERGDDEKRAMIRVFDTILALPISVERDATLAQESITKFQSQRAS